MNMTKIDANTLSSILSEKATGVSAHFARIRDGSMPTQRSPLFKNLSQEEVIKKWQQELSRNSSKFPRLIEYENTRWEKFGQQGGYPPLDERLDLLAKYWTPNQYQESISKDQRYQTILSNVRMRLFKNLHDLRPLTAEQVLRRDIEEDKVNTNSGCPDFSKRSDLAVQAKAVQDANSGKCFDYPAILGSRSSRLNPRFIFMFPMSMNIKEKQYVVPIMDAIRKSKVLSFSAWEGFDEVEQAMHSQGMFRGRYKASMDYSKMDTTMKVEQTSIIYDLLAPVFQPRFRPELLKVLKHVNEIPIMVSPDKWILGEHGYASGSGWTNLGESIMSELIHELINMTMPLLGNQLLGDDGAMSSDSTDFAHVIETASAQFGLTANKEKQDVSVNTLHYLQRFFDESIMINGVVVGSYPTVLALNAGMNPERFHDATKWSAQMEILRWIMILENCKHHPLFHEIIHFFIKGDKFRLGLDIPGYFKRGIINDYKIAKSINGFIPSYTTAHVNRGIHEFEVVKYLKTLR